MWMPARATFHSSLAGLTQAERGMTASEPCVCACEPARHPRTSATSCLEAGDLRIGRVIVRGASACVQLIRTESERVTPCVSACRRATQDGAELLASVRDEAPLPRNSGQALARA